MANKGILFLSPQKVGERISNWGSKHIDSKPKKSKKSAAQYGEMTGGRANKTQWKKAARWTYPIQRKQCFGGTAHISFN